MARSSIHHSVAAAGEERGPSGIILALSPHVCAGGDADADDRLVEHVLRVQRAAAQQQQAAAAAEAPQAAAAQPAADEAASEQTAGCDDGVSSSPPPAPASPPPFSDPLRRPSAQDDDAGGGPLAASPSADFAAAAADLVASAAADAGAGGGACDAEAALLAESRRRVALEGLLLYDRQRVYLSMACRNPRKALLCEPPSVKRIDFYTGSDLSLAGFIEAAAPHASKRCQGPGCGEGVTSHVRTFLMVSGAARGGAVGRG